MKTVLVFLSIFFFAIAGFPALCQTPQGATETDLVVIEIAVIKTEIKNLNGKIDDKFNNLENRFDSIEKNFDRQNNIKFNSLENRFDSIEKNFDRQNNIIIACIGIPLAILAIGATVWGILVHRRSKKDQTLEKQIEVLTQEIETLKQQKIVSP